VFGRLLDTAFPFPQLPPIMMLRNPEFVPLKAGVFALCNDRRRVVYVSWTQNLQKRSHSMSHMLLQYDRWTKRGRGPMPYWPIRGLPKYRSGEFIFRVESTGVSLPVRVLEEVARVHRKYQRLGYQIVGGHRIASGKVRIDGKQMSLADAVRDYSDDDYLTVYRRLQRGWTIEQALGIEPPDPRWHKPKQRLRKERERERYEMRAA
jgi:hypothetical protein